MENHAHVLIAAALVVGLALFICRAIWRKRAAAWAELAGSRLQPGRTRGPCSSCGEFSHDLDAEGMCDPCFRRIW